MVASLEGRVAIITGGCGDIGAATARAFVDTGARVVIADLSPPGPDLAALGERLLFVKTDVSDRESARFMVERAKGAFGRVDILVNAAGICLNTPVMQITPEEWDKVLSVNLKGTLLCSQEAALAMMSGGGGKIVNVASIAGKTGGALVGAHYAASKAGVICLTKSLARELAPHGILVNAVAPGVIETRMIAGYEYELSRIPLGRKGTSRDVAEVILFLASPMSDYMTGATVDVNGGMLMS